ncbi:MAG: hypothetical protein E6Z15_12380 [Paenibacillus macerans]|nr:hypothetical protein [Paenibacillus macerans]
MKNKRNRGIGLLLLTLLLSLALTACGGAGGNGSGGAQNTAGGAGAEAAGNGSGAAQGADGGNAGSTEEPVKDEGTLTVYLNDFDDIIAEMFEKSTGYKVNLVTGNGAEIMSRIEAEKGNPHWDVVWADMMPSINGLGQQGIQHEHEQDQADGPPETVLRLSQHRPVILPLYRRTIV